MKERMRTKENDKKLMHHRGRYTNSQTVKYLQFEG
jgi:hypothetical protein